MDSQTTRSAAVNQFGTEAFYASLGRAFVSLCAVVPVLFAIEALDQWLSLNLDTLGGIIPRHVQGIDGVVFAPFLHASWDHLYGNSVPLILLGTFALAPGWRRFVWSTVLIMIVSGLGVWFIGDPGSVVVGASGVIFGWLGLLFARGLVERSWWNLGVTALVGLLYWWQLSSIFPTNQAVAWQAHLIGLVAGMVAAVIFRAKRPTAYVDPDVTLTEI